MKHLSLEEPSNTHQFLRDSILQFVSLILLSYISIKEGKPAVILLIITQYTGYIISKFFVWMMASLQQPLTHRGKIIIIGIKTILLIDFKESWKLDKIKNYQFKPVLAVFFNGFTLLNIIFTVLFIKDFLNYSLLMV